MSTHTIYRKVGSELGQAKQGIRVDDLAIGGAEFVVMAGLSHFETRNQLLQTAAAVQAAGARILCAVLCPQPSLDAPMDLPPHQLPWLAEARQQTGLKIVCEITSTEESDFIAEHADILQVGARHMQNFALLKRLGRCRRPVLLNRGAGATLHELLCSAEYIASSGNEQVILCERGIRAFKDATHRVVDIAAVPVLQRLSHLPVLVNPSEGTGHRAWVGPLAKAAVAAGADGLVLEVKPNPHTASSSGPALTVSEFHGLMAELRAYAALAARTMPAVSALV